MPATRAAAERSALLVARMQRTAGGWMQCTAGGCTTARGNQRAPTVVWCLEALCCRLAKLANWIFTSNMP
jgi:hypothetical protein